MSIREFDRQSTKEGERERERENQTDNVNHMKHMLNEVITIELTKYTHTHAQHQIIINRPTHKPKSNKNQANYSNPKFEI